MSGFRNWCFTDFSLSKDYKDCLKVSYLIYGLETCPKTGNKHHQGYFELKTQMTMSAIKKALKNTNIHLEVSKGSAEKNKMYCSKENVVEEYGTPKRQGKRNDLQTMIEAVKKGMPDEEILPTLTSIQSVKCLDTIRYKMIPERKTKPIVKWFYGDTGTGKTHKAVELFNNDYDIIDYENNFVIGYTGKKNVLWDEFRGNIPLKNLLKMLDKYKCIINVKGTTCNFSPENIIITSCKSPSEVYIKCGENIKQLLRRIDSVELFKGTTQKSGGNTILPTSDELDIIFN